MEDKFTPRGMVQLKLCVEEIRKFEGVPPYDTFSNIVQGDGYFYMSIKRSFEPAIVVEAERLVGIEMKKWKAHRQQFINTNKE